MTEEIEWKMIRFFGIPPNVVSWELDWLDKDGWRHYHPHTGDMSMIEPAPPKDWKPICYDSQYNKLNGCDPMPPIVKTCQQCPFLAARHRNNIEGDHHKNENDEKAVTSNEME